MKILFTALAMIVAAPAAAQTAPAVDPHAGHAQHGQPAKDDHSQHGAAHKDHMKCCEKGADGKMMECCEKAKASGGKMDCCAEHSAKKADAHAGHDMSKH